MRLIQQAECASFFSLSALCCCPKSCNDRFSCVFSRARGPVIRAPSRAIDPYRSLEPSARPRERAWHRERAEMMLDIQKHETIGQKSCRYGQRESSSSVVWEWVSSDLHIWFVEVNDSVLSRKDSRVVKYILCCNLNKHWPESKYTECLQNVFKGFSIMF